MGEGLPHSGRGVGRNAIQKVKRMTQGQIDTLVAVVSILCIAVIVLLCYGIVQLTHLLMR